MSFTILGLFKVIEIVRVIEAHIKKIDIQYWVTQMNYNVRSINKVFRESRIDMENNINNISKYIYVISNVISLR